MFKRLDLDDQGAFHLYRWNARAWVAYATNLDAKDVDVMLLVVLKPYYK